MGIETDRLVLRPLALDDVDDFHRISMLPAVRKYLLDDVTISRDRAKSLVEDSVKLFNERGYGLWFLSLRDNDRNIGFTGYLFFHDPPELQLIYALEPDYWGHGLATEAARAMIRYGFDTLGLDVIKASADAPNAQSLKVLEKAGMRFDKREILHGLDTVFYSISRD
jgi:ribosomal-protein-alanine N-acetyltransferase